MRKYLQDCPIARTLDLVGDRWTLLIIRDLFMGLTKFSDLRAHSSMPPKVLSARLKWLMEQDFVARQIYSEHPLRAEYHLTPRGESLLPIMLAVGEWGLDNLYEGEPALRAQVSRAIYDGIPEARLILEERGYVTSSAHPGLAEGPRSRQTEAAEA
jgi:DNA-binding HxlR family transcriptional regulator